MYGIQWPKHARRVNEFCVVVTADVGPPMHTKFMISSPCEPDRREDEMTEIRVIRNNFILFRVATWTDISPDIKSIEEW